MSAHLEVLEKSSVIETKMNLLHLLENFRGAPIINFCFDEFQ